MCRTACPPQAVPITIYHLSRSIPLGTNYFTFGNLDTTFAAVAERSIAPP